MTSLVLGTGAIACGAGRPVKPAQNRSAGSQGSSPSSDAGEPETRLGVNGTGGALANPVPIEDGPMEQVKRALLQSVEGLETKGLFYDDRVAPAYQTGKFTPLLALASPSGFVLDAPDKTPPLSTCPVELGDPVDLCARALHAALRGLREDLERSPGPYTVPPKFEEDANAIRVTVDLTGYTFEFSKEPLRFTRLYVRPGRTGHN